MDQIVSATEWLAPETPSRLSVAHDLGGWLVHLTEEGPHIVGFSVEEADNTGVLRPPTDMGDAKQRLEKVWPGVFNSDLAAKGLGSHVSKTPEGLQPHTIHDTIAVRQIPLVGVNGVYTRPELKGPVGSLWRLARHFGLLVTSAVVDYSTRSTRGTQRAAEFMERHYGDSRLVFMPAPPIWRLEHGLGRVAQRVQPQVMLVRGGRFAEDNPMTRIGTYRAQPR